MIVVKFEMWPHGNKTDAYSLAEIRINNTGTGDQTTGNYEGQASHCCNHRDKPGIFKTGKVFNFPRRLSVYRLLSRILKAMGET